MTRKTLLSALCAATGLVSFAASSASFAADPAPATGKSQFLADRHVEKYGLKCESCHTKDMKVKQSGDYDVCVDCHGDYEKMIKKTEGKYQVNPHAQHEGVLPCTECHKGHKTGVNYCGQCHSYIYQVP